MVQLVLGQDDAVGYWVHNQFGCDWRPDPGKAFGYINEEGQLVAGFTFTDYNKQTIYINVSAVPGCKWWSPQRSWEVYDYVFNVCKCKALRARILSWNHKSIKICEQFGLKLETTLKDHDVKGDLLIYKLNKEDADVMYAGWKEKHKLG